MSKQWLLSLVLFLVPGLAFAQTGTLSGVVTDAETGDVMPGANVFISELSTGAATDVDGVYRIEDLPVGDYTMRVTFIGYQPFEEAITIAEGANTKNAALQPGAELDEVVVTALGIEREERSLGYSVQEVETAALERANESNLVNALAGKVAGVYVNSSGGQPGQSSRITIRGLSSVTGNNQPLFVVDGVPISSTEDEVSTLADSPLFRGGTSNRALDIDPSIIADVSVLKGAAATALYGSRAANGAIIITTKSGSSTQAAPRITYNSTLRWDDAIIDGFQDEYLQGLNGCFANGLPADEGGYVEECTGSTNPQLIRNWGPHRDSLSAETLAALDALGAPLQIRDPRDDFYQTGAVVDQSLSLSGGTATTNYFLSVGDLRQEGIVQGTDLNRTSLLAKFGAQLTDQLNVETSANYIRTNNVWLGEGNGARSYLFSLNFAPINYDLTDYVNEDGSQRLYTTAALNNPFWITENNRYTSDVDRLIASTRIVYEFFPGVTLAERLGIDMYGDRRKEEINVGTRGRPNGSMFDQKITRREINSDLTLTVDRPLTGKFSINAVLGNNINSRYYQYDFLRGTDLGVPDFFSISNASNVVGDEYLSERLLYSGFGQATLDYDDIAYLTLTGRNDWSSTLPEDNNSYFYSSASVGLVFSEAFANVFDRTPLSFGKVRGSIAQIGNDAPVYATSTTFVQANPGDGMRGDITFPFRGANGYQLSTVLGNPDLKPEISTEYEVGLDLRFLGDRARLDAAYYDRSTKDQIFTVPMSAATGFTSRLQNAGEIRNHGVELTLGLTPVETRDFRWDVMANFSKNTTEVVELVEGVENIFLGGFTSPQIRIMEGEDGYGVIWGLGFQRNDAGQLLVDDDGYPVLADELGPIGNVQPDWLSNVRTSLSYKGLTLGALVDIRKGGDVLNLDQFYTVFYGTAEVTENRGTEFVYDGVNVNTGEVNDVAIVRDQDYYQNFYSLVDENYVEDGSFIKLREVSVSYALPTSLTRKMGIQGLMLSASGRNLWTKTDFSYGDPEGSLLGSGNAQGLYHMVTPGTKSYALGLRLTL